ncbi:hypothetical protein RRF57_009175 [Xylaria bambusicola]|uniref:Uncharacterized protein n=1 Tax=Xylaria bambusicola TaxID=326684 RepID=A0AAN7UWG1_9PEZI
MSMSSSTRGTSLSLSQLTPEHDLGLSLLSMLLKAAHQANTPTLGMPQLLTLPLMEASTRVQSPDFPEATDNQ